MTIGTGDQDRPNSLLARRAFVVLVGQGAMVVALGGLIRFIEPKGFRLIRPPGALVEEEFLSLCIRCDKCREACPWGIIAPVPLTESAISAGTPILQGHCRRCWLCIPVCPTGALR
jgi:ferredoxin-type protein NapG